MSNHPSNDKLFTPSGCLRFESYKKYYKKHLTPEQFFKVEDHLSTCLLCKDAFEGMYNTDFESVRIRLNRLKSGFRGRLNQRTHDYQRRNEHKRSRLKILFYAVAAVVILMMIVWFFS